MVDGYTKLVYADFRDEVVDAIKKLEEAGSGTVDIQLNFSWEKNAFEKALKNSEEVMKILEKAGYPLRGFKSFVRRFIDFCFRHSRYARAYLRARIRDGKRVVVVSCSLPRSVSLSVEPIATRKVRIVSGEGSLDIDRVVSIETFDSDNEFGVVVREAKKNYLNKRFVVRSTGRAHRLDIAFDGKTKSIDIEFGLPRP